MNIMKKLIGASALAGIMALSVAQLSAERTPDEGKNFTVSNSPESTVFNMKTPSNNRHVHDYRNQQPEVVVVEEQAVVAEDDCAPGVVSDSIDQYAVSLDKSAPATVALNEPFTYNYTVTAKQDLKQVIVKEQIPAGTVYVSSNPEAEVSGSNVTWTLYNLANGVQAPLELVVKPTSATDLSSCATITAIQDACTTTSVGVPELAIVKTTPNEQVLINTGVPWTITVTNTGNFCAYDVVVTDTLPAGISHESGETTLVTEVGTLAPGESREITINTTAVANGQHTNVASATSSNTPGAVTHSDDVKVVEAGLEVTKDGTPMQFVGKRASYKIVAKNTGDVALSDVVVTDTVPAQNKLLSASGAQIDGNTATWTVSLGAGESKNFDVTVLGLEEGTYCNQVSASSAEYGLSGNDDACTEWRGYPALLIEVIDTEDPLLVGEETTYIIQITNQGTAPDTNVKLDIQIPRELSVVSAAGDTQGTITGNNVNFAAYPSLAAKEIIQFRVVAKALSVGDARFKAQMNSDLLKTPVPEEEATQVY
ncbi:Unannotated [Lentimonas sp. CC4]|nr:Unannotated [Lentimonas sp. CC4]CAA6684458.1 Unannotated [Lentimonas sp. CC6]CAA7077463.1 Unannotated [Lentimonas sp. CC4]CAA7171297.1 Unannotated [Lentimonas sp. CC21]CAA7183327.1 Unannotated [Lentimonas sp. CC8]